MARRTTGTVVREMPVLRLVSMGRKTTVGGNATESFRDRRALASDLLLIQPHTTGASPVTVLSSKCAAGSFSVTFSGDPSSDHQFQYAIFRNEVVGVSIAAHRVY